MNSQTAQFVTSRTMGIYETMHPFNMWADFKNPNGFQNASTSPILDVDTKLDNQSDDTSQGTLGASDKFDQESPRPADKVQRRLAQNREAARKSRMRKKAYVQQLESSRLKLMQLEQELEQARQQGMILGGVIDSTLLGFSGNVNSGIVTFEMQYGHWVEEQNRQTNELRTALNSDLKDVELNILVEDCMKHYYTLFALKANVAKTDAFYLMSGMWKTSAERFFLWIGGFRPSEVLQVLLPQLDLADQDLYFDICKLKQCCQQAEDALSQGMDKLQQNLVETIAGGCLGEGNYMAPITLAMEKLEALVGFVSQADHLRQETLQQMFRLLATRQRARGLLVLGEYCQRLRALSTLWAAQSRQPV